MADIVIPQRRQLPPAVTGQVKPPLALASRSGEIRLAQSLAKFSGAIFNQLIEATAANEEAEFQSTVNVAMQDFDTFVAANPGASFDDLQKARDRMMTGIEKAGQKSTTGIAKRNNTNWLTRNKNTIFAKTQTSMEAIRSKQELTKFNIGREQDINNFDIPALTNRYNGAIEANLIEEEIGKLQLQNDIDDINLAQLKLAIEAESNIAFGIYQQAIQERETPQEAERAGLDYIRSSEIIPGDEKQELEQDLVTSIGYRRSLEKQEFDRVAEEQNEAIDKAIDENGDVQAAINTAANLTTKEKNSWEKTWKDHNEAILKDEIQNSPFNQHDPAVYNKLLFTARNDPFSDDVAPQNLFDKTKLGRAVGGVSGGITTKQRKEIANERDKAQTKTEGANVLKRPSVVRAHSSLGRILTIRKEGLSDEDKELLESDFLRVRNDFDAYVLALEPDDKNFSELVSKERNRLLRPIVDEVTLNFFEKALLLSERTPILGRLAISTEESRLVNKKIKKLREQNVFETFSGIEQSRAEELIRSGSTVEDAISQIEEPTEVPQRKSGETITEFLERTGL